MKSLSFALTLTALALPAGAAVLATLPTPVNQGGMIHINVSLQGNTLFAVPEAGTPVIQPLAAWKPGDTFDAASPWYASLDPTQGAGLFNSQFGLLIDAAVTDPLPAGSKIMVSWLSGSAGLQTFQWKNTTTQAFNGMLGSAGSPASWDWSTVNHGMMHPMFVMPAGAAGTATASLGFTLTDASGTALEGYQPAQTTLNFTVVPEPSAVLLSAVGATVLGLKRRRSHPSMP